ncbi:MAG: hypothetical protein KJP00_03285 [Bacteroidia bacterium]|nr:hypothetical protein [Bacteroidia bacterium]
MERDPLERFIQTNRAAFDKALPSHDLWSKIEEQLPQERRGELRLLAGGRRSFAFSVMKYAATVLAIVSLSVFGTLKYVQSESNISPSLLAEIEELQQFYNFEVERKKSQLTSFDLTEVNAELNNIDQVIDELHTELEQVPNGSEEKVIHAMISNYQLKVLILERMLEAKTNQVNNTKEEKDEVNI